MESSLVLSFLMRRLMAFSAHLESFSSCHHSISWGSQWTGRGSGITGDRGSQGSGDHSGQAGDQGSQGTGDHRDQGITGDRDHSGQGIKGDR